MTSNLAQSNVLLSLREAFISILPFMILLAMVGLIEQFAISFEWFDIGQSALSIVQIANNILALLFPLTIVISVSYYLSKNLGLNTILATVLAVCSYIFNISYMGASGNQLAVNPQGLSAFSIIIPLTSTYLFAFIARMKWLSFMKGDDVSRFLTRHINLIPSFVIVFLLLALLLPLLFQGVTLLTVSLHNSVSDFPMFERLILRTITSHVVWLLGVHGDHIANIVDGTDMLEQFVIGDLTAQMFLNTFVHLGGAGATWGLIFACLIHRGYFHEKNIAKISAPLALFNINEPLIYAIPLVLNVYFIVPFIMAPLFNLTASYFLLHTGVVSYSGNEITWITPVFFNGWLLTEDITTILYQAFLIAVNTAIYFPFLAMSIKHNSTDQIADRLSQTLSVASNLENNTESSFVNSQRENISSQAELNKVLDDIEHGSLKLFYQPKFQLSTGSVSGFEALIRLERNNGDIVGPYFLEKLRANKLTHIIDYWVVEKLHNDLTVWAKAGYHPKVSLNMDPNDLTEATAQFLIEKFSEFPHQVEIELLESGYVESFSRIEAIIKRLHQHRISTAMDDFGTGYSNIAMLAKSNVGTIKFDQSMLADMSNEKSRTLYRQLSVLCKELGFHVIAEGVEVQQQMDFLKTTGVDEVQGWIYAKALPFEQAHEYVTSSKAPMNVKG
ncbi:EAL domain-containing protein [Echinimonas agarilytica]|uniref:EAL domain-containing protein n=1 Tax=Echinimonas agarilytica TaxID=1215918 RepID=A0AA42B6M1_9GAMM|nr:EAL domain-containing protein [Echinimonas agarilytica]MCM2678641.1 EAL domain-containing protein [Echinimonas agarilytica]